MSLRAGQKGKWAGPQPARRDLGRARVHRPCWRQAGRHASQPAPTSYSTGAFPAPHCTGIRVQGWRGAGAMLMPFCSVPSKPPSLWPPEPTHQDHLSAWLSPGHHGPPTDTKVNCRSQVRPRTLGKRETATNKEPRKQKDETGTTSVKRNFWIRFWPLTSTSDTAYFIKPLRAISPRLQEGSGEPQGSYTSALTAAHTGVGGAGGEGRGRAKGRPSVALP